MSKTASTFAHLRDILLLPFSVTCVVPYLIYNGNDLSYKSILLAIIGGAVGCAGLILFFYTVFLFKRIGKGTLAPWSEKQKLIVEGPYRYCRNPMISGVFFILIGEVLVLQSLSILIWAVSFFVINTIYFIISEEPALYKKFGDEYKRYKQHVPRWLPTFKPYNSASNFPLNRPN